MLRNRMVLLLLGLAPFLLYTSSTAQGAAYIKFDGFDGESTDANHEGWSEVLAVDHLMQQLQAAAGQSRRQAQHSDLVFIKELDKASPKLAEACLNGFKKNQVIIEFQSNFENPFIWERITLESVLVSGYDIQTSDDLPMETFSLNYQKIHWKYVPRNSTGETEDSVEFGWDQEKNAPFSPGVGNPTPTPTPVVDPNDPTPTPIINPTDPTPTPIVGPNDPTPTPPSQTGVTLGSDLLKLYEDEFQQKAVIVRELNLAQDPPGLSDIFSEQFYSMATLPDGNVITNVKKRNLDAINDEDIADDTDILIRISPEGEMTPFAQITPPHLLLNGEPIRESEAKFLNLSFNGKDEISVLVRVNGKSNQQNSPYAAVVLIKIIGPFDASSVGSFRVY